MSTIKKSELEQAKTMEKLFPHQFEKQTVIITDSPYHTDLKGKRKEMSKATAAKMIANKWAKVAMILLIALVGVGSQVYAQGSAQRLRSTQYPSIYRDTVVNTATISVTTPKQVVGNAATTTVWLTVTKISGTVGGTITLQGSIDGTTYKAINTPNTQTALATITATDATNTYHWVLLGNPFNFYRVSWTGAGTMSAWLEASLVKR